MPVSLLTHLNCPACGRGHAAARLQRACRACGSPLLARYDLAWIARQVPREALAGRPRGLWRWAELLPVREERHRLTLGEGGTPLLPLGRLGGRLGLERLYLKDEAANPSASFQARGLGVALSRALELGAKRFVLATTGNAGGALAAYAAYRRVRARIFAPRQAPRASLDEMRLCAAELVTVDGQFDEALRQAARAGRGWFDLSVFREPYRLEGLKTLGFELAQAFGWQPPDVILVPTGSGSLLVGLWKAFTELGELGWIGPLRPRLVAVQAEACAPLVRLFNSGAGIVGPPHGAPSCAAGLRVPEMPAGRLVLQALRESRGTALAVSEQAILAARSELAQMEGVLACPEGAAGLAGLQQLISAGALRKNETVVLFNTSAGLKYI